MNVKHHFARERLVRGLFIDSKKFSDFRKKLIILSKTLPAEKPERWGRGVKQEDNEKKILGDGFELFCELLILHMGFHPHIGLTAYDPIDPDEDKGVDAYALNLKGERSAVQCKFVTDTQFEFKANNSIRKRRNNAWNSDSRATIWRRR